MKRHILIACMASTVLFYSHASNAETLEESVKQALATHPSVEAALAGKTISEEDKNEARSGLFPEISTNLSFGRVYADTATSRGLSVTRGAAYSNLGEGSGAITQPLFDGFETFRRIDAANARIQSANYNITDIKENLAYTAVQAHLAVMQAEATLAKTKSYYDVIEDYLNRIQFMVDEGVADESEAAQARNISLMLKSTVIDYEGQLNAALARYREITGAEPKSNLIKPSIAASQISSEVDEAISFARQNHPLMKLGQKDIEAAGYDVEVEKADLYPDVDGEISYLKRDQREAIGGEVVDGRALIKMSWDFETGGAYKARTRRSKAQYSEIIAKNHETGLQIEGDLRRAYAEYETALNQMDLVKKREIATKELFEAYEAQFEGARVRLLQLMQAENQLFSSQLESITAEYRYYMAHYAILASSGQLLEQVQSGTQGTSFKPTVSAENIEIKAANIVDNETAETIYIEPKVAIEPIAEPEPMIVQEVNAIEEVKAVSPTQLQIPTTKLDERVIVPSRK